MTKQYSPDALDVFLQIAEAAHEANRTYCEYLGDHSQPRWDAAPEWQKKSAINGIIFHYENPSAKPSDSHENWLAQKTEEGWSYGPVKDPDNKRHPCYMPYEQLPEEQRLKDLIFIVTCRAGFSVYADNLAGE